jgi:hypothetical protein
MTPEELKRFDEASDHPYECRCELCLEWRAQMPPEDEEEERHCDHYGIGGHCLRCGEPLPPS